MIHSNAYSRVTPNAQGGHDVPDDSLCCIAAAPRSLFRPRGSKLRRRAQDVFPQLELIEPHAQRAFDLLVRQVESNVPLPPDQCVARGGSISDSPAQAGHCASLFVP